MNTKTCSVCRESKSLDEFALSARNKDGRQYHCKECGKAAGKRNYLENRERYFAKAKQRDKEMREKIRVLKSVPCADCQNTFDPICMDFDHLPEFDKVKDISDLMRGRVAWSTIEAEIKKCEVVCSNCHRIRTRDRLEVI